MDVVPALTHLLRPISPLLATISISDVADQLLMPEHKAFLSLPVVDEHGRPLGLGSVEAAIDNALRLTVHHVANSTNPQPTPAAPQDWSTLRARVLQALWVRLLAAVTNDAGFDRRLAAWVRSRRLSTPLRDYRTKEVNRDFTIYNHHTAVRRQHGKARRDPTTPDPTLQPLLPLHASTNDEAD